MGGRKVAIIGAGSLGALLAARIPTIHRKVIISERKAEAVAVADEVGGVASDQPSAVRGCQVVFLTVPAEDALRLTQEMAPHLEEDALVVNAAVEVITGELAQAFPDIHFAAAKVVGSLREMLQGSAGAVILDHVDHQSEQMLRNLLEGLGSITLEEESKALIIRETLAAVMARAESELRDRLEQAGISRDLVQAAILSAPPGMFRPQ